MPCILQVLPFQYYVSLYKFQYPFMVFEEKYDNPAWFFINQSSYSINVCLTCKCQDGYIQERCFFFPPCFFFYNCRALSLNLHDNVYGISFILPGECISFKFWIDNELCLFKGINWRKYQRMSGLRGFSPPSLQKDGYKCPLEVIIEAYLVWYLARQLQSFLRSAIPAVALSNLVPLNGWGLA